VGTLFGVAMIPLIYLFAKRLFGKSEYAFLSAFLLSFDFMHFAQTRIATIDVYGVFFIMLMYYFMYRYYMTSFYHTSFRRSLMPLLLSGLFFGIGAACKWITLYGGAGLALLFFLSLYERYLEYEAAKSSKQTINRHKLKDHALIEHYNHVIHVFPRYVVKSVAWCGLFFIIIPGIIYSLSFLPILTVPGEPHTVSRLIEYQKNMYDYHSKLKATHAFGSPWYEWPFMVKPIWYYTGQSQVPEGEVSSIVSMGNPAVWWIGILAVIAAIFIVRKRKDKGMFVVLVAFFSQYVPWMLVTRLTFIYHFFAMVPFMVLCITYVLKDKIETNPVWKKWTYAYMGVVLGLFAMFYPILSGAVVSKWYVSHFLSWFRSWYFYS
jgi:dolichyl-phosphate-mannose-protein mannosyltransferase